MQTVDKQIKTFNKTLILLFATAICILIICLILIHKKILFAPEEFNEKATIEYLKKFTQGDIKKIVLLTDGHHHKFDAVCEFIIRDKNIINEFKMIISRQSNIIKKNAGGQRDRETHITLYNKINEKYSFILNSEPYSGNRQINEIDISFF